MKAKRKQEHMHVQEKWQWIIMWIIRGLEWMERRGEWKRKEMLGLHGGGRGSRVDS